MALATYQFRPTTVSHWEQVVITHAIVGGRRWRAHDGYLFAYQNGGWAKLSGLTPPIVLREVSNALVTLEGFYIACGKHAGAETARNGDVLLARLGDLLRLGRRWEDLADLTVHHEGHFLRNHKGPGKTPVDGGVCDWAERQADFVSTLRKKMTDELSSDSFRRSYVEWTSTPHEPEGLGIAFEDCYVGPDVQSAPKSPAANAYVQLRYPLMLPDPVLEDAARKVKHFLNSRFFANGGAFRLYLALEALAARHEPTTGTLFSKIMAEEGRAPSAHFARQSGDTSMCSQTPLFSLRRKS